jgi:hypothetical protein
MMGIFCHPHAHLASSRHFLRSFTHSHSSGVTVIPITKLCAIPSRIGTNLSNILLKFWQNIRTKHNRVDKCHSIHTCCIVRIYFVLTVLTSPHWEVCFLLSCRGCQFKCSGSSFRLAMHNINCALVRYQHHHMSAVSQGWAVSGQ